MKSRMFIVLVAVLFAAPALVWAEGGEKGAFQQQQKAKVKGYKEQQRKENKEFRESLKGKAPEEKVSAIKEHRQTQYEENKELREKMHKENREFLQGKLANNKKLTDAEKGELISCF